MDGGFGLVGLQPGGGRPKELNQVMPIHIADRYLRGMQSRRFTLAAAGCFRVKRTERDDQGNNRRVEVCLVELQDLLHHCASAGAFIMKHSMGRSQLWPDLTALVSFTR